MSNMLIEKRTEFVAKLSVLEATRQAEIDAKVAAYRATLEASTPKDEILKVTNVIAALDEVIGYESATTVVKDATVQSEQIVQNQHVDTESVTAHQAEARPGMATVFTPTR